MQPYTYISVGEEEYPILLRRDGRLKKSARWNLRAGAVHLRIPPALENQEVERIIESIQLKLSRRLKRGKNATDEELLKRAQKINDTYFGGTLIWESIRWVSNMEHRLGSCTYSGSDHSVIRISDKIKQWPDYVVDYVISHELSHIKFANHSADFWHYLDQYPHVEKAHGFIDGFFFAQGLSPNQALD
jgi:predicted metal-dependent hydrolase